MSQLKSYTKSPHTSLSMHALPKLMLNNSYLKFLQKTRKPKLGEDMLTSKTRKPLLVLQSVSSSSTSMGSWMSIYSTISISIGGSSLTSISDHGIYLNKCKRNQLDGELYEQYFPGKPFQIYSDERRPTIQHFNNLKKNYITLTSKEVLKNEKELKVQNINDLITNRKPQHNVFDLNNSAREKDTCSDHSVYLVVSDSSLTDLSPKGLRSYKLHKVNKDLMKNDQEVAVSIGKGLKLNYFPINNPNGSDHIINDGDEISDETEDYDNVPLNNSHDVTGEDIAFSYDPEQMTKDLTPHQLSNEILDENFSNVDSIAQDEKVIDIEANQSVVNTMNTGQQGLTNENNHNISNMLTNDKSTETQIFINNSFGAPVIYTEKHAQKGPFCIPYRVPPKYTECKTDFPYEKKCVGGCNKTLSNIRGPMSRTEKVKQQEYNRRCTLNLDKMKDLMERLEQKMAVEVISVAVGNDFEFAKYDIDLQTDNVDLNLCCPNRRDICPCLLRRYARIFGTPSEQAIRRKKLRLGPCECTQNHPDAAPGIRLNKRPKVAYELEDFES